MLFITGTPYYWSDLPAEKHAHQARTLAEYRRFSDIVNVLIRETPDDRRKKLRDDGAPVNRFITRDSSSFGSPRRAPDEAVQALRRQVELLDGLYSVSTSTMIVLDTNALYWNTSWIVAAAVDVRAVRRRLDADGIEGDRSPQDDRRSSQREKAERSTFRTSSNSLAFHLLPLRVFEERPMTSETASNEITESDWQSVHKAVELFVMALALAWQDPKFSVPQDTHWYRQTGWKLTTTAPDEPSAKRLPKTGFLIRGLPGTKVETVPREHTNTVRDAVRAATGSYLQEDEEFAKRVREAQAILRYAVGHSKPLPRTRSPACGTACPETSCRTIDVPGIAGRFCTSSHCTFV
jgi:hypothetical protein